jgi:hypothetical protein
MAPPRRTFDVSHKLLPLSSRVVVVPGESPILTSRHMTTGRHLRSVIGCASVTPAGSTSPNAPRSPWMGYSTRDRSWRPGSSSMASTDSMPERGCLGSLSARLVEIRSAVALLAAARLVPITQSGAVDFSDSAPDVPPRSKNRRAPASWQHNVNAVESRRVGIRSA